MQEFIQEKITRNQILQYYSDERIASQIFLHSKGREVAGALWDGSYEKRPNILQFPSDVAQMVRRGVTSFHYSVERWSNPMAITAENYNELRTGWDVVIDIDSKIGLEESKIGAKLVCKLLEKFGIRNYTIKFSGRRGFHIILPWEMFPKEIDYKSMPRQYPEIPKIISDFIRSCIKDEMMKELSKIENLRDIIQDMTNPFYFIEIEKDWGNRHMFRAPYSFNEKTWLVSLPLSYKDIEKFSPEDARHEKVLGMERYQDIFLCEKDEAAALLTEAVDWHAANTKEEPKKQRRKFEGRFGEEAFPPCIKTILGGMPDGRKRSVFTLMNFLRMMNWKWDEIEARIYEWNEKNKPPLPRTIIASQIRHAERRDASPPANCTSGMYYADIGICRPDEVCKKGTDKITIKNPVSYPFSRLRKKEKRGFSCICGKEFPSVKALKFHKAKSH